MSIKYNNTIETLSDMTELASTVYTNWDFETDANSFIEINAHANRWVRVNNEETKHLTHNSIIIMCGIGSEVKFSTMILETADVAEYVLMPMIEQHLNGDRTELKSGLTDYLNISPAIK
jgi:tetraacyldisaccharide-1-P 4'-kinase